MSDVTWSMDDDGVGVITLNRPEARNALTHGMYGELERLARGAQDAGVRCLIAGGDRDGIVTVIAIHRGRNARGVHLEGVIAG